MGRRRSEAHRLNVLRQAAAPQRRSLLAPTLYETASTTQNLGDPGKRDGTTAHTNAPNKVDDGRLATLAAERTSNYSTPTLFAPRVATSSFSELPYFLCGDDAIKPYNQPSGVFDALRR